MINHKLKIHGAITVVIAAVILIGLALFNLAQRPIPAALEPKKETAPLLVARNPLNGQPLRGEEKFFPVAVMLDNAFDVRPQYGLAQADIVYEALAESNITRLMAIYASNAKVDKVGPVRSARAYFADWAQEYQGAYLHVGGSPDILERMAYYNLADVDQIGAGEIYFWRDKNLKAPHNVLTSDNNWLRVGELRGLPKTGEIFTPWHFTEATSTNRAEIKDLIINYKDVYKVEWRYNEKLAVYERWQGGEKFLYNTGDQARANNIIVQVAPSKVVDNLGRREIDSRKGGKVYIFNALGVQTGVWQKDSRTLFFHDNKEELKLLPGKTWVQVVDNKDLVEY